MSSENFDCFDCMHHEGTPGGWYCHACHFMTHDAVGELVEDIDECSFYIPEIGND